jgi:glycosyltransferase involved in cell wall biosynthesis
MRRIKVLYVIGQLSIGGTETQLVQLVSGLDKEHFEPVIACLTGGSSIHLLKLDKENIPVIFLERETRGRLAALWNFFRVIREFNPDIVHSFAYASRLALPLAKLFSNAKIIVSIRTQPEREINWLDRWAILLANLTLPNSRKAVGWLQSVFGERISIQLIYNGLDIEAFKALSCEPPPFFAPPDKKVICVIARLWPVKGLDFLLVAFALLVASVNNVQLWFVGDGPERENLKFRSEQLGIASNVVFLGMQEKIPPILSQAQIGVLSSSYEGLPNAIIEYMASGLPVVATDVGGVSELVQDGLTGYLVPPGNAHLLAEKILYLLNNPELSCQFGKLGLKRVEKYFSLERMIKETEKTYQGLVYEKR